jgi:hypothetical protein
MRSDQERAEQVAAEAVIRQIGRWTYLVYVRHGICTYGLGGYGWRVFGRKRAARKARRALADYVRREQRSAQEPTVIASQEVS